MGIKIVKDLIDRQELITIANEGFGDIVKVVVDVEKGIMAVGGELHADEEIMLMEKEGSGREHLWGINIYPKKPGEDWIEFDSMINIKPSLGNRSRNVEHKDVQQKIKEIVANLIGD